jgi:hypothetical protein
MSVTTQEIFSVDITGDGAQTPPTGSESWPGGPLYLALNIATGTGTVHLEVSSGDLGAWVPCGSPVTSSGLYRYELPDGILYRVRLSGTVGISGHIDIFVS